VAETPRLNRRGALPPRLAELLSATDEAAATSAWNVFLSSYGDLILRTARAVNHDHDAAMDAYAHVLERFRADDFARLRKFSGGDSDNLSRWLVVVSRRMCLDLHRQRYGRTREHTPERERLTRKRLVDELWEKRKPADLPDPRADNPEMELRRAQLGAALRETLEDLVPEEQLLLALRFDNQLSARRIAEILDFPSPFHVYRRLNGLLARLRQRLESRGIAGPEP
jgi:RNA polymerase sigma factor (sigma-70 family)